MTRLFKNTLRLSILILSIFNLTSLCVFAAYNTQFISQEIDSLNSKTHIENIIRSFNTSFVYPNKDANLNYIVEYKPETKQFYFYRKIDNINVSLPYIMSVVDYDKDEIQKSMLFSKGHNNRNNDASGWKGSNHEIIFKSKLANNIFGNNIIDIRPSGTAQLNLSVNTLKVDNPTLQESLRKVRTIDVNEKMKMNIRGTIGDRLKLGVNYNTEANFDFENQFNLEYKGQKDDILRSVKAGNVSLLLPGTLITGSQSLFGVKTKMQFGNLSVTSVFSQQKGKISKLSIEGGAQKHNFDIPISSYDKNKHFFLSNFFRDLYEETQKTYPLLSKINIQRIQLWITNRSGNFNKVRNIIAFADLGETGKGNVINPTLWNAYSSMPPSNKANDLYNEMTSTYVNVRDHNKVSSIFRTINNFKNKIDYEKIVSARLLSPKEYTVNSKLGFISLNTALNEDEVLAVAYEYDYNGKTYRVGEFANEGVDAPNALYLKLIKSSNLTPLVKEMWNLMMKNIYSIGAYQISKKDFVLNVAYVDNSTGTVINYFPDDVRGDKKLKGELLLRMMNLDKLNQTNEPYPDGVFDYIENETIYPQDGKIIFPVLEPLGSHLEKELNGDKDLINKYVYKSLYNNTQTTAKQETEKDKFRLQGSYKSSVNSEIYLGAQNIPRGSVILTVGSIKLTENIDYIVDYSFGTVKIINQALLNGGSPIQVSIEGGESLNLQTKTMLGTHINYQFNNNFNIGATILHLSEHPLMRKVNIGEEPVSNTIYGFNASYFTESQSITNMLNKIPLLSVKALSSISFEGEFAKLIPSSPKQIKNKVYIDDFDGTKISIDMHRQTAWSLAATPQDKIMFPESDLINDLRYGYRRAKLAWYVVDPLFTRKSRLAPQYIKDDLDAKSNNFIREVFEKEIFPNKQAKYGQSTNISVLNLAYYPKERGAYNFNTNINKNGSLKQPKDNWAGIIRRVETGDFEAANIEYIEFWMMDPFVYNHDVDRAGDLYFNLGDLSEDVLRDSHKYFEQGLPRLKNKISDPPNVERSKWGYSPKMESVVNAFSNNTETRLVQDVGLDGMNSLTERTFHINFLNKIQTIFNAGNLSQKAYDKIKKDPASDDYHYFRGSDYDENKLSILDRYKDFNGTEGNSVPSEYSKESYATAATTLPDQEDINRDNTLNETEDFFQYKVHLAPDEMTVGHNYITDKVEANVKLANGREEKVNWYQFRIPINHPDTIIGHADLHSIRFMRIYLHNFKDTVILRFATLDLVRSEWRMYNKNLHESNEKVLPYSNTKFEVGAVNIEENATKQPIPYVLPPGVDRVIDSSDRQKRELNEQSILLKVTDVVKDDRKAVFKTVNMDMRQYSRLKMYVHAEEINEGTIRDGNVRAFLRLGSDASNNYYEYELPLIFTTHNSVSPEDIWPKENMFNFAIDKLLKAKLTRNENNYPITDVYSIKDGNNLVKIKGNPNLGDIRTIMIGVRSTLNSNLASFETWFNELCLSNFNDSGGQAANARINIKLSDLGNIAFAGKVSTVGFGGLDENVSERSKDNLYRYNIIANLDLGRFIGANSRMTIPFYYSKSKDVSNPKYFPLDPDIPLKIALNNAVNKAERDSLKNISQNVTNSKSVNFTNVSLLPKNNKTKIYDVSNLSATYSYNEINSHNVNTKTYLDKDYRGVLAYDFNDRPKPIEPFKKMQIKDNSLFKFIKDFNFYLLPAHLSYRMEILRRYSEKQLRVVNNSNYKIPLTVRKDFYMNRYFNLRFNLTKNLKLDFKSITNASINEPLGVVNKDMRDKYSKWKDTVIHSIVSGGRKTNYQHNFNVSYILPFNKLPYMGWTNSYVRYSGMYNWLVTPIHNNVSKLTEWGNEISNSNNINITAQLNFSTLYNYYSYLKRLSRKYDTYKLQNVSNRRTVRYNKDDVNLIKGKPYVINHRLKTREIRVRVFDKKGNAASGKVMISNINKVEFIPDKDYTNAVVMVTGAIDDEDTPFSQIIDYSAMLLTGLKNLSLNYTQTNSTILPGYLPTSRFLGSTTYNGFEAPGYAFLAGLQNRNFAQKAVDRGWITRSPINSYYTMTHREYFMMKTTIEPIRGLRIYINANRNYSNNMSEYYRCQSNGSFIAANKRENGSFTMSFNAISTAFEKVDKTGLHKSANYMKFLRNRIVISDRLAKEYLKEGIDPSYVPGTDAAKDGYGLNSQQVIIPAFLSAYGGKNPKHIFTNLFPDLRAIQPNWRITYNGLEHLKLFSNVVRSFNVSHGYRSAYSVVSYITDTKYKKRYGNRDMQNNFIPQFQVNSVSISEMFNPLLAINITWKNNLITRAEIKKARTLNLNLFNKQLIENYNKEYVIGLGYRFDKMNLILGSRTKRNQRKISNDLNMSVDLSIEDNIAIIRKIEEKMNQITAGQKIISLRLKADYMLNDRFNVQLFYDKTINSPYISLAYPTVNSSFGLSFRLSIAK